MPTDTTFRISRLSPAVINKIAAGEVIERPASVVKELLENSIDALSKRITVEIVQGGTELIRLVDDGQGIHPDDMELAITSHATSKLRDADDLFQVHTLGFRGEALASIAEVSHLKIRSKQRDQPGGVRLEVHGGVIKEHRLCGAPDGTLIEVRDLFYNVPVRRTFMKTVSTEFAHIAEQFTRVALAHPNLHLTLIHNDKTIHDLPPSADLRDRLELFFGSELARHLIPVDAEHNGTRVWGYACHPSQSRSSRKSQYLFVNGRWFQDRSLQHALGEAYRGLIMVGRYPIAFLFLELSPDLVDVNVHPTKSEVRFRDSQNLYRLLLSTLRNRFLTMELDSRLTIPQKSASDAVSATTSDSARQQELVSWVKTELDRKVAEPQWSVEESVEEPSVSQWESVGPTPARSIPDRSESSGSGFEEAPATAQPAPSEEVAISPASGGRAMQVHDCYLVVEDGEGIVVIDQHALHERIMYEHLRRRVLAGNVEVQKLLMPITVQLSAREAGVLLDQQSTLDELGLHIHDFGGNTIALSGYPTMLRKADPERLLKDIVDLLESSGRKLERRDLIDKMLHMMSCKAAIKAGQRLSIEEIETLVSQRHLCDDHHHCPHGRPTALKLTRAELDRQFGRLG